MSHRASKFALLVPVMDADPISTNERYPAPLVISGLLTFCLAVWAIVIFAVMQYV